MNDAIPTLATTVSSGTTGTSNNLPDYSSNSGSYTLQYAHMDNNTYSNGNPVTHPAMLSHTREDYVFELVASVNKLSLLHIQTPIHSIVLNAIRNNNTGDPSEGKIGAHLAIANNPSQNIFSIYTYGDGGNDSVVSPRIEVIKLYQ